MATNKKNKFQFVSMEEIETKNADKINIVDSPKEVSVDFFNYGEEEKTETPSVTVKKKFRFYFGYEARILLSIFVSIVFILIACFLIVKTMNHKVSMQYPYNEEANVSYKVCSKDGKCLEENNKYDSQNTKLIHLKYKYNLLFSKDVKYKLSYSVVATTKIFDKNNPTRIYYKNEDELVSKKSLQTVNSAILLEEDVNLLLSKYKGIVNNNKYRYTGEYSSTLEVALYVIEDNETRNVSNIKMSLDDEEFEIYKTNVSNVDKFVELERNKWDTYTIFIAILATAFIIIAIIIIYRATRLVIKTYSIKSTYEQMIEDILNKYDNVIVIARDGYESTDDREIVKVDSFEELLEEKNKVKKPIVYSRVNDVKSEFVLEGKDKLYKYVLKEADINE